MIDRAIFIGDDVKIELVEVLGPGRVRLGITAPPCVAVYREELIPVGTKPSDVRRAFRAAERSSPR